VVRIRSTKGNSNINAVLWDCLFGTPRGLHWHLLFEVINRTTKYDRVLQDFFNIMMLINTNSPRGGSVESFLNMKEKSVRQVLSSNDANIIANRLRASGLTIPIKRPSLKLTFSIEVAHFSNSSELRRIGVGYKDKGNLPLPGSQYDPVEYNGLAYCPVKLWNKLLQVYKSEYKLS